MNTAQVIQSQYLASLAMLKQAIAKCPPEIWDDPNDKFRFWSKSYHAVFFAHLYLQKSRKDFVEWEKHHDPDTGILFTKDEVLEYLEFVEKHIAEWVSATDFEAESGFKWYPVNKLEMQFINIRHIQQHAGELFECLGSRKNIELDWVGLNHHFKEQE
jgi:hypothetical protein